MGLGLGLYMKLKKITKSFLTITVFSALFFGASCLKKQNLEEDALGDAVAPEQVASALSEGFGQINYDDIKVNDKSSIILTQTIQDGVPQTLEQQDVLIQAVSNTDAALELTVLAKTLTYSGNTQNAETSRVWNKYFTKYSGYAFSMSQNAHAADATDVNEPMYMFQVVQNLALGSCYNDGNYPETCHNLTSVDMDYRVPPTSAYQHNCADIYNCTIKAKKVEFDLIRKYELESDGKPKRIHYTFILSPYVPFTSRVLQYCSRSLYDIQGVPQKVLADVCYNVNNYTFGK
jgi:hypothetical protein